MRTTDKTVTFNKPFTLAGIGKVLPAGAYRIEMDEELLQGISFHAYRRVQTLIHLPSKSGNRGLARTLTIDPKELDAALIRDHLPVSTA